ncbi:acyl-CoA dehydrogenase C-terminal domain-containing protein [Thalassorhabdomicrobium marinisediminis]|uniref:Acetyl-CoA dehydrogenase-like C-terminal domain-containing protein n=1 Tax=Thalassorhabdomicrobium marinisediminis TaxID=2170577 RepID=A0A2T7FTE3_9RHOB|nr:acyl-CoA dehydrogenase C-terminal domain-containing protein [Thalassorhabdomicrobium marinisediminis]PVA05437.1 hypothetical protein DC363_15610 [Thalassorhabdomicrobium marinisediminis]
MPEDWADHVTGAADLMQSCVDWAMAQDAPKALSAATNIQEVFGLCLGAWIMGDTVRAATARTEAGQGSPHLDAKLALAQVYATHLLPKAKACQSAVVTGADAVLDLAPEALRANSLA